jgi:N-acyl homoserine lactone hydrolase
MPKTLIVVAAVLTLVAACVGPQAFAQQPGKSGIERMYVLNCGDIALENAAEFTPGATGPGTLSVTCYLIKHRDGWLLFDTGLGDQIAAMPNGFKSQVGLWTVERTFASELAELGLKPVDITYLVLSHSHPDHVGNLKLFSEATLVVQKAEYDWKLPDGKPRFDPAQ